MSPEEFRARLAKWKIKKVIVARWTATSGPRKNRYSRTRHEMEGAARADEVQIPIGHRAIRFRSWHILCPRGRCGARIRMIAVTTSTLVAGKQRWPARVANSCRDGCKRAGWRRYHASAQVPAVNAGWSEESKSEQKEEWLFFARISGKLRNPVRTVISGFQHRVRPAISLGCQLVMCLIFRQFV